MSKLPTLAIIILLLLGAALWFTASGSLDLHVKNRISQQGALITGNHLSVEKVKVETARGQAHLHQLTLPYLASETQPDGVELLKVKHVNARFDQKALKSSPSIIDTLTLSEISFFVPKPSSAGQAALTEMNNTISATLDELKQTLAKQKKRKGIAVIFNQVILQDITLHINEQAPLKIRELTLDLPQDTQGATLTIALGNVLQKTLLTLMANAEQQALIEQLMKAPKPE